MKQTLTFSHKTMEKQALQPRQTPNYKNSGKKNGLSMGLDQWQPDNKLPAIEITQSVE